MTKTPFYNNLGFRLAAPILLGFVVYLLILMFFDSVEMLANNFFSREVLFVIGLTLLFFELNRLVIVILNRFFTRDHTLALRLAVQYVSALALVMASISLVLHLYFIYIEGFSTIRTELVTFNAIFIFATLFYHLYYFSLQFLFKRNDELFEAEQLERDNLELELNTYKNQINSEFLFQSLETIVGELPHSKKNADSLIDQLAQVYRYTLDNQENELVRLSDEMDSLQPVSSIFMARYPGALRISQSVDTSESLFLVPGTLQVLLEDAVAASLLSDRTPVEIRVEQVDSTLYFRYRARQRITLSETTKRRIEQLKKTYDYLAPNGFEQTEDKGSRAYKIPLMKVEEE